MTLNMYWAYSKRYQSSHSRASKVPQKVDREGHLIATRCRIWPQGMLIAVPACKQEVDSAEFKMCIPNDGKLYKSPT